MAYGIVLENVTLSPETMPVLNLTLTKDEISNSYEFTYNNDQEIWVHMIGDTPDGAILPFDDPVETRIILISWTSENVGDEYTVNLSVAETATDSFTNATIKAIEKSGYPLIEVSNLYNDTVTTVFDSQTAHYRATINESLGIATGLDRLTVIINDQSASYYDEDAGYGYYEYADSSVGIKIELATGRLIDLFSTEAASYALSISAKVPNTAFINAVKSALNIPSAEGTYELTISDGVITWNSTK